MKAVLLMASDDLPTVKPSAGVGRLNLLVYGSPKVGKTSLAGTAEDDERCGQVLFVDLEGGTLSISHRGQRLDVYQITEDFDNRMNQVMGYLTSHARTGDLKYGTVVIDSLSELCDRAMAGIQAKSGSAKAGKSSYDDWNIWSTKMRTILGMLRDLPVHLIVTALEETDDDIIQPLFPGKKVSVRLPGYFDTVARLSMKSSGDGQNVRSIRTLQLQPSYNVKAGDRADYRGRFPATLSDPTISKLLDRLDQGQTTTKTGTEN